MAQADSLQMFRERFTEIQRETVKARNDPARWPYREAAAVLSRFQPAELNSSAHKGWKDFLPDCVPVPNKSSDGWWQLREDLRRETLRRLGSRVRMKDALAANTPRPDDELQRALDAAINNVVGSLIEMSREQLSAILTVRDWLGGILDGLPSDSDVRRALVIADILAPMKRLAGGDRFVGRKSDLATLRAYVGVLNDSSSKVSRLWHYVRVTYYDLWNHPPFLISGPGGVGKSSLISRLILDHSERFDAKDALPFVYLDLDRPALNPSRPLSLVAEAAAQLMIEWPHLEKPFRDLIERITPLIGADASIFESVRGISSGGNLILQFGQLLNQGSQDRPVLFVIDTFEEAQYLGFDVVQGIAGLLTELQKAANILRIVLAGRADMRDQTSVLPTQDLVLGDLPAEEARDLLRVNLTGSPAPDVELLDTIIDMVGRNPLSLKLAATVVNQQGLDKLKTVETRNLLLLRVKTETVQARLYGRILAHIHDDDIRRLVKPGLLVRRLTADVIRNVLAVPCGIAMTDPNLADDLMNRLGNEVALFFREVDGSYRHRPDVRRLMLKDLEGEIPPATIRDIHDRAVTYYAQLPPEPISRAEEIYHRLMRGDDPATVASRRIDGMDPYLRTALEELPAPARIWLSSQLGVTPDRALLKKADLENWETITALSVQRLISTGDFAAALRALSARTDRTDSSPLFLLESEAYRLQGNWNQAKDAAERGVTASARVGNSALQRDLLVQLALIEETSGNFSRALAKIDSSLAVPVSTPEPIERLRLLVARIRLLRKLGTTYDDQRRQALDQALDLLTPEVRQRLNQQPALLREVVAEIGLLRPDLLNQALEVVGLQVPAARALGDALRQWDGKLKTASAGKPSELAQRAGLQDSADPEKWLKYVEESGSDLSTRIINWRSEMEPDRGVDKAVIDVYRSGVDSALNPRGAPDFVG